MSIVQKVNEILSKWIKNLTLNDASDLSQLHWEATQCYTQYNLLHSEYESSYNRMRNDKFIELNKSKRETKLTDEAIKAIAKDEAEKSFWQFSINQAEKENYAKILDSIKWIIIDIRSRYNKELSSYNNF